MKVKVVLVAAEVGILVQKERGGTIDRSSLVKDLSQSISVSSANMRIALSNVFSLLASSSSTIEQDYCTALCEADKNCTLQDTESDDPMDLIAGGASRVSRCFTSGDVSFCDGIFFDGRQITCDFARGLVRKIKGDKFAKLEKSATLTPLEDGSTQVALKESTKTSLLRYELVPESSLPDVTRPGLRGRAKQDQVFRQLLMGASGLAALGQIGVVSPSLATPALQAAGFLTTAKMLSGFDPTKFNWSLEPKLHKNLMQHLGRWQGDNGSLYKYPAIVYGYEGLAGLGEKVMNWAGRSPSQKYSRKVSVWNTFISLIFTGRPGLSFY